MKRRVIVDALARLVDAYPDIQGRQVTLSPAEQAELDKLLGIVCMLRAVLVPVQPAPEFVALLRGELMDATPGTGQHRHRSVLRLVIGAVAVSSIVSAAVYFVVSRGRSPRLAA